MGVRKLDSRKEGIFIFHQLFMKTGPFLPPVLAEEVIFLVASVCVCVSVCAMQAEPLDLWT